MYKLYTSAFALFFIVNNCTAQPPAKYYDSARGKTCAGLKTALKIITNNGKTAKSYANLWNQYVLSDIKPRTVGAGSTSVIYDIYNTILGGTDTYQFTPNTDQCGVYNNEGDCYNREHSVPLSWFNGSTGTPGDGTDYHFIFPVDGFVNAKHGNQPYGEVNNATWTSQSGCKLGTSKVAGITGAVFEPLDSFKGDIARAFFYFITHYEDNMVSNAANADAAQAFAASTFPSVKIPYLKMMLRWHQLDPVSSKERARNNAGFTFQKNRNPFVDSAHYVNDVWNANCPGLAALPVDFIRFAGKIQGNAALLNFITANEININNYEVEMSNDGIDFKNIGTLSTNKSNHYSFTHFIEERNTNTTLYFRIKAIEVNGQANYSDILPLHNSNSFNFTIANNPCSNNKIQLWVNGKQNAVQAFITNNMGILMSKQTLIINNNQATVSIPQMPNGYYFITLISNDRAITKPFVLSR